MYSRFRAYYFEHLPINRLSLWDFSHMYHDGIKTGGMQLEQFLNLREDIEKNGLINPIVVEVDSGNPPRFRVAMGNNRVEAWKQLGNDTIKALCIFKQNPPPIEGLGEHEFVDHPNLESFMAKVHPGDELWRKSAWAEKMLRSIPQSV